MDKFGIILVILGSLVGGYLLSSYGIIPLDLNNIGITEHKIIIPILLVCFVIVVGGLMLILGTLAGLRDGTDSLTEENEKLEKRVDDCDRYIRTTKQWVKDMVNPREDKVREIVRDEMSKQFKNEASAFFHEE